MPQHHRMAEPALIAMLAVMSGCQDLQSTCGEVSVGPDGSLYVGLLALLSCLASDTRPVGGVVKLEPSRS